MSLQNKFDNLITTLHNIGIVPVIKLQNTDDAVPLAKALWEGGIRCAEVTFRAEGADKVISAMTKAYPEMLVGAGTVLTLDQVEKSIAAGAKFCVAPGLNPKVVKHCLDMGVPFAPGVSTSSEIEQAIELGLNFVKFFPAEQAGGLAFIKAVAAPYSSMKFMPTGGITENNINTYLAFDKIVACGGSWIVPENLVKAQNWAEITRLCRVAVDKMLGFELQHVGFNCADEASAAANAETAGNLFGLERKDGSSSIFSGSIFEFMKSPYLGKNGHIAIATNDIGRAVYALSCRGVSADPSTAKYDSKGALKAIYLNLDLGGFAVHLFQK